MFWVGRFLVGLGAASALTFSAAHAQAQSDPGYILVELKVNKSQDFNDYVADMNERLARYGGTLLVQNATVRKTDGTDPRGVIAILRFDTIAGGQKWLLSRENNVSKHPESGK